MVYFRYLQVTLKSLTAPRISLHPPQCLMISPISCSFGSVTCSRKNYSCVFISLTDYIPKLTVTMFRTMSDIHSSNFDKQNICNQRVISLRSLIIIFNCNIKFSKKRFSFDNCYFIPVAITNFIIFSIFTGTGTSLTAFYLGKFQFSIHVHLQTKHRNTCFYNWNVL